MSQSCCLVYFLICRIQFTIADIFPNSSSEQMSILKYNSQRTSEVVFLNLRDVDSVVTDLTFLNIVETVNQVCDGCLTGTGRTYESKFLSWFCKETDVFQNYFIRVITKSNIFETYISCQLCVAYRTVCGMRMFPCPHTCSFFAFCDVSIGIFLRIDKFYIAFILFRFLINEPEDSFCTSQSHNDCVKLLCHLHKRLCEALCKLQIGSHDTKSDAADSCYR